MGRLVPRWLAMSTPVTVYYLEMTRPADLRPKFSSRGDVRLEKVERPTVAFSRFLYDAVGRDWHWVRRQSWSPQQWLDLIGQPEFHTWVLYAAGAPAGYFELQQQAGGNVEIVQLGLLGEFIGTGLGGHLVSAAAEQAWKTAGASRVWLHTCTRDHPHALANYQARGFRLYQQETRPSDV